MGFMEEQAKKAMEQYIKTATDKDIDALEKQGIDVTIYREKLAERKEMEKVKKAARFTDTFEQSKLENPINLSKLDPYKKAPRDINSEFVKDCANKPPFFGLFGKDKYVQEIADAQMVFADVVQANWALWEEGDYSNAPAVIVFAMDEKHRYDVPWLKKTIVKVIDATSRKDFPADCAKMVGYINNHQSRFCCRLPESLSDGAEGWVCTYEVSRQKDLPKNMLPTEGILPLLLTAEPKDNVSISAHDVHKKYYEA